MKRILRKNLRASILILLVVAVALPFIDAANDSSLTTKSLVDPQSINRSNVVLDESNIETPTDFEISVDTNYAYYVESDAEFIDVNGEYLDLNSSKVFFPRSSDLVISVQEASSISIYPLSEELEVYSQEFESLDEVEFTYTPVEGTQNRLSVNGLDVLLTEGHSQYSFENSTDVELVVYDPNNLVDGFESYLTNVSFEHLTTDETFVDEETEVVDEETTVNEVTTEEDLVTVEEPELTEEQFLEIVKYYDIPIARGPTAPHVEYDVINWDAPAGYFVSEESNYPAYWNGHNKVSLPTSTVLDVEWMGYAERNSGDSGHLNADGDIEYDWCWDPADDKARWECEGLFFPMDTEGYWGGASNDPLRDESYIKPGTEITMYYPEAMIINGIKYDVKSTWTDFYKNSDSLGSGEGGKGWYTTFAVSHYFYDGYWLDDFQSVKQTMTLYDSSTGEEIDITKFNPYGFKFGMFSLNNSGADVSGRTETAEALRPVSGLDNSNPELFEDMNWVYQETLEDWAWQGGSDKEGNGIAFYVTSGSSLVIEVAKNPSAPDEWGNKYWEIAWFVPSFWAETLPEVDTDAGDAPTSYGEGLIELAHHEDLGYSDMNFYIGDTKPHIDGTSDEWGHTNGLNDDENPSGLDDETGFVNYSQETDGYIYFDTPGDTITIEVAVSNDDNINGQLAGWIDFNDNGSFEESEGVSVNLSSGGTYNLVFTVPDNAKNASSYMRVVLIDNQDYILNQGNAFAYDGMGETEDYPIKLLSDTTIEKSVTDTDLDGTASLGEDIKYSITVTNLSPSIPAKDVHVRDSLLESLPSWLTFNDDVEITPSVYTSGNLVDGDYVVSTIDAGGSVTITFSLKLNAVPEGIVSIDNIVTDDNSNPGEIDVCPVDDPDCADATIPITPLTDITKSSSISGDDTKIDVGETVSYTITVTNPSDMEAKDINVRDSLLEDTPSWLTFNDDVAVDPTSSNPYGSLEDGSFYIGTIPSGGAVNITFSFTVNDIPDDTGYLTNVATDNGGDPGGITTCDIDDENCGMTVDPLNPETTINKKVSDTTGNDLIEIGEKVYYTIEVTNPNAYISSTNVHVRDSLLEDLPEFLKFNDDVRVSPDDIIYEGSLEDGSFIIAEVQPMETVSITFSFTVLEFSDDTESLINVATDDNTDPNTIDPDVCPTLTDDCATTEIGVDPETDITKSASLSGDDIYINSGETITYTLEVFNDHDTLNAININVRDSLVEDTPDWLTFNDDISVNPSDITYHGDMTDGTFFIDSIAPNTSVVITFSFTVNYIPVDEDHLKNIATDSGDLVEVCTPGGTDCASTLTPIDGESTMEKFVEDGNTNGIVEEGEVLNYTIKITNPDLADMHDVPFRDTLIETHPDWLTYNDDLAFDPSVGLTGDIADGSLVIDVIEGESVVTVTYSFTVGEIPSDVSSVDNIATIDGTDTCLDDTTGICDSTTLPVEGDSVISKTVTDSDDDIVQQGDVVSYSITVTNNTASPAHNVNVRDDMLENLPTWLTYNGDLTITPDTTATTGSFDNGTFMITQLGVGESVTITYSVTVDKIPSDLEEIDNIATDDGSDPSTIDPEVCLPLVEDCGVATLDLDPETTIKKSVTGMGDDGYANIGDTLVFTIDVTNPHSVATAYNVLVRDSLLESTPSWLTFNDDISFDPSDITYTGDLTLGTFAFDEIAPASTVSITYSMTVNDIPDDEADVVNIATDNGKMPDICLPFSRNCDSTITPLDPETTISKSVTGMGSDNLLQVGETLNYTLAVTNPNAYSDAIDVAVRDSLVNDTPSWLTYNNDMVIDPETISYTGNLSDDNLVLDSVPAGSTVYITYSFTMNSLPSDEVVIGNVATDDGSDPSTIDPEIPGICDTDEDCGSTITDLDGETIVSKSVSDANDNDIAEVGEVLTYTLVVENTNDADAIDVIVRDSLVENTPGWLTYNDDITIDPTDEVVTGDLRSGNFTIANVEGHSTTTITYSFTVNSLPGDISVIQNIVTDDNTDPSTLTPELCETMTGDCDNAEIVVEGDTVVKKAVTDGNTDGVAQVGEILTYSITVTNNTLTDAHDVWVRDDMLEDLPSWLSYDGNLKVRPYLVSHTGTLVDGDLKINKIAPGQTVTITYYVEVVDVPDDLSSIENIVTDDGSDPSIVDPDVCVDLGDCFEVITPTDPDTVINKTAVTSTGNDYVSKGDEIRFTITVSNTNLTQDALNVNVRDNLLEDLPSWLIYNNDLTINPSDILTTGSLASGDFVLSKVPANSTVTLTYTLTVRDVPTDVEGVANIVTDDGIDPDTIDPELPGTCLVDGDCGIVITPVNPDTTIEKSVTGAGVDGYANVGDTLEFSIVVNNTSSVASALDVHVRDSLLENIPTWLTFNDDVVLTPGTASGSLVDGDYVIDEIAPGSSVVITYSLTMNDVPTDEVNVKNIATDDGSMPLVCLEGNTDCGATLTPIDGETAIEKFIEGSISDGVVTEGETLTYTIRVSNPNAAPMENVVIRDSLIEQINSGDINWITYNDDMEITPSEVTFEGDLATDNLILDEVPGNTDVYITYSVTVGEIPSDVGEIENIVTNDGTDTCLDEDTCSSIVVPTEGDTVVSKTVTGMGSDGIANVGEVLEYTIVVENNTVSTAHNIAVRDSLLESIPSWLTFNNDIVINPETTLTNGGNLLNGTFEITEIAAGDSVVITYSFTVNSIPDDAESVINIVVDENTDPNTIDPEVPGTCLVDGDCGINITPVGPETSIEKSVEGMGVDGYANVGETLTYTIAVTNPSNIMPAYDVKVRDSLLEDIPSYLSFNNDVSISPDTIVTSGDLTEGTYSINQIPADTTVYITYSLNVVDIPSDVAQIHNIATDNGQLPSICLAISDDCAETITPVDPETVINKTVTGMGVDGYANVGDVLEFSITVTNTSDVVSAMNTNVRDSLLEDIPSWLKYNNDMIITPTDIIYGGKLTDGTLTLLEIPASTSVTIKYTMTMVDVPSEDVNVKNIVTDNGNLPSVCLPTSKDCDSTLTPIDGETSVEKFVRDDNENGVAELGEVVYYTIKLTNPNAAPMEDVAVRDTLVEAINSGEITYLTYNDDMVLDPTLSYTGNLNSDNLVIDEVPGNSNVLISFSVTVDEIPTDVTELLNIATNDGTDFCDYHRSDDCDIAVIDTEGDTKITKEVTGLDSDGIAHIGDTLNYTITIENYTENKAFGVNVRDSLLENLPTWLTYNSDIAINPSDTMYTGSIFGGNFIIDEIDGYETITITYSLTINSLPNDEDSLDNIVTDNGIDPDTIDPEIPGTCSVDSDCSIVITPIDPETIITKTVSDEDGDNLASEGEVITFNLNVENPNTLVAAKDVVVRDSLLEDLPDWLIYNNDIHVTPDTITTTGNIKNGTYTLDEIPAGTTAVVTYSVTVKNVPSDVDNLINIATDDNTDPSVIDPEIPGVCDSDDDCGVTITPVNPETIIEKSVSGVDDDGYANVGDTLYYTLTITNTSDATIAQNIAVRDSLVEGISDGSITWLDYNDDMVISPASITDNGGSLATGDLVIDAIDPAASITITYSVTMTDVPDNNLNVRNIATDDGSSPLVCLPTSDDCGSTLTPIDGETNLEKFVMDEDFDGIVTEGETLTYAIRLTNPNAAPMEDVVIRDSLIEAINNGDYPWLSYNNDMTIDPSDILYTGDLATDDLVITEIKGHSEVIISYTITVGEIPSDVSEITNIATNDGTDVCIETDSDTCDSTTLPVEGDTIIEKTVDGMGSDGYANLGDTLGYTLTITNNTAAIAHNINVRDNMLESLPSWLTYNGDIKIDPSDTAYTGSLASGDFTITSINPGAVVTITYSVTINSIPSDVSDVINIITDDSTDPDTIDPELPGTCLTEGDCNFVITPVNPDTNIKKSVTGMGSDGYANIGDTLEYKIEVTNENTLVKALDVAVRDSLLEEIPTYLAFNNDILITPDTLTTTGSLLSGDFVIDEIDPNTTITITYSMTVVDIPSDVASVDNIATDNGEMPSVCLPLSRDCSHTSTPVDPETIINKSVTGMGSDGWVNEGETLEFRLEVTNTSDVVAAIDTPVRDSLLEDTPTWLTFNDDLTINPVLSSHGSLFAGNYVIDEIPASTTVVITYSMTLNDIPKDDTKVKNIATDDGEMPSICLPSSEDCASTITPIDGETEVEKFVEDANDNGVAELGEVINYTIKLTNPNASPMEDVEVRDTLVEQINADTINWLSYNDDMVIDPALSYSGDLLTDDLVIDEVPGNSYVLITYSVTVDLIPDTALDIQNIATNDGSNVCVDTLSDDCDTEAIITEGDTVITKDVEISCDEDFVEVGDTLSYTITVTNNTANPAINVPVKDSLLQNIPYWLSYDGNLTIKPSSTHTTGTMQAGDFVISTVHSGETITLTYSFTVLEIPDDIDSVDNVVTDDGTNPDTIDPELPGACLAEDDCASVVSPVNPETLVDKTVDGEDLDDGYVNVDDVLYYTLTVENTNDLVPAYNVVVRDSIPENTPDWLKYTNDVVITPSDTLYTGDLRDGDFTILELAPNQKVTITYSIVVLDIPDDVSYVANIVTDDGRDPNTVDPEHPEPCDTLDNCGVTINPVDPETYIQKEVTGAGDDELVQVGETLEFTILVTNPNTAVPAKDVIVRDSMLEDLPEYLEWDGTITTNPSDLVTTGNIADGDYTILEVQPDHTVSITYSVTLIDVPEEDTTIKNIATDDGNMVTVCVPGNDDCGNTLSPIDGETDIEKFVYDENRNGVAEEGEVIHYQIKLTNNDVVAANDVDLTDTLLEDTPDWLTYNDDLVINPDTIKYTGDLRDGDFTIEEIAPGEVVNIYYSFTVGILPNEAALIYNIATDNDSETCEELYSDDCDGEVMFVEGDTRIDKTVTDANDDGLIQVGEKLTYTIEIENYTAADAHHVIVRDSMLENTPSWLLVNHDMQVSPDYIVTGGNIYEGDFYIDTVKAYSTVTLTYSVTVLKIPTDDAKLDNLATDDGTDPDLTCKIFNEDCSQVHVKYDPNTVIEKDVLVSGDDEFADIGDVLTYTIDVYNPNTKDPALLVQVRDSLLENTPDYLQFNNDIVVDPDVKTTGSLMDGDFEILRVAKDSHIYITYSMTVLEIPDDVETVDNMATDNGRMPGTCLVISKHCDETQTPLRPDTLINKEVTGMNEDGFVKLGDTLDYTITVENTHDTLSALDVAVRDSVLENLPTWLTLSEAVLVTPDTIVYSGDMQDGDFVISEILPNEVVTITYSLRLNDIPTDGSIINIVTDDGLDPDEIIVCSETSDDCDSTLTPIDGETDIEKFVVDENANNYAEVGETLNYTIKVSNTNDSVVNDVAIRDTLLENTPSYLTFNNDIKINPDTLDYTGSLLNGDFVFTQIPANTTIYITYSMTLDAYPTDGATIDNIVTKDGTDTCDVDMRAISDDCDQTSTDILGTTNISKSMTDQNGDGLAQLNEKLTYTIAITNDTAYDALNVAVRDSMLENLDSYLTYNNDLVIKPNSTNTTGSLSSGNFVINKVKAYSTVYLTYSLTLNDISSGDIDLVNIATDDGSDPSIVIPETCDETTEECSNSIITVDPDTDVDGNLIDENGNLIDEDGNILYTGNDPILVSIIALLVLIIVLFGLKKFLSNKK